MLATWAEIVAVAVALDPPPPEIATVGALVYPVPPADTAIEDTAPPARVTIAVVPAPLPPENVASV